MEPRDGGDATVVELALGGGSEVVGQVGGEVGGEVRVEAGGDILNLPH